MFFVVDERVEGFTSELFAELASELQGLQVVPDRSIDLPISVVVFRPENAWAPDSLSSTHLARNNKPHFLDLLSERSLKDVKDGSAKLVFDISRESTYLDAAAIIDLHHNLQIRSIKPSNCILVSAYEDYKAQ